MPLRALILMSCLLLAACSAGDDTGDSSNGDTAGDDTAGEVELSCFYSCNTALGIAYGCNFPVEQGTCDAVATEECGDSSIGNREEADCFACDTECAPSWYQDL